MSSNVSFKNIKVTDYTDKSVVVQGETRMYKEDLKKLGGKYNPQLKGGPGWVFPKTSEKEITAFIKGGKRLVSEEEEKYGEERSKEKSSAYHAKEAQQPSSFSHAAPTLGEFSILLTTINNMSAKINKIELALNFLLNEDQKKLLNTIINVSTQSSSISGGNKNKSSVQVRENVLKRVVKVKEEEEEEEEYDLDIEEDKIPVKRLLR